MSHREIFTPEPRVLWFLAQTPEFNYVPLENIEDSASLDVDDLVVVPSLLESGHLEYSRIGGGSVRITSKGRQVVRG
jgi:hypothetical protein